MQRLLFILGVLLLVPRLGYAFDESHDSHPLDMDEVNLFSSIVCQHPLSKDGNYYCSSINGRPNAGWTDEDYLSLDNIAYGSFTYPDADEAYLSYTSSIEYHVTNFGGGILFERINGQWGVVRWYPGLQMNDCLAFSFVTPQGMFCLTGYVGQGEVDSSLRVIHVPFSNDEKAITDAQVAILKAQDDRQTMFSDDRCEEAKKKNKDILLSIDVPRHSNDPAFFAEADIIYTTPSDVSKACKTKHFEQVKETKGVIRFKLQDGQITAITPITFASTDY